MKGHIIRVSKIVSAVLSGGQLPHVRRSTSCGAKRMPSSVTTLMKTAVSVATLFASRQADSVPFDGDFSENVVMNAVESAPSANRSAQQIWQPERHQKRVEISSRAKEPSKHHFANQSEDAAAQNRDADDSRRTGARSPVLRRSHRRTKNRVSEITKEKIARSCRTGIFRSGRSKLLDVVTSARVEVFQIA